MSRQIFLDTETTGFDYNEGHRIIEIGAVECIGRKLTGKRLHHYFKPDVAVESGAFEVHGIGNDFLSDKPAFEEKVDEMMDFLAGAELVIHNSAFDIPFLNYELSRVPHASNRGKLEDHCDILDTLSMARQKHPGQRNSLDALCKRYYVSNAHRSYHGALLDAELLAEVYLAMTGGQTHLVLAESNPVHSETDQHTPAATPDRATAGQFNHAGELKTLTLSEAAQQAHQEYLAMLSQQSGQVIDW